MSNGSNRRISPGPPDRRTKSRQPDGYLALQSWRRASIGSTRVARRAGTALATAATASKASRLDPVKERLYQLGQGQCRGNANHSSDHYQCGGMASDEPYDRAALGTQGHADADLAGAARH